ncbi:hypothetical protein L1987_58436 [Smallanthus sonchifolius]|uniref:Uncharacterized protein n=1 Tax=Smallanthus sonchifolius TaxID=185202 RepID=A0ACB9DFR6_9ASTR|nr:hypothetical protein L1987_58436 [Smallanthus sonchifolius]
MVIKGASLARFLVWFLAVASMAVLTYAAASPKVSHAAAAAADTSIHPQAGCRCCNFVYKKSLITCGKVCCVDGCC